MEENTNNSSKKLPIYEKNDIEKCIEKFKTHIINNINDIPKIKDNLLKFSLEKKTESEFMSSISLKIYLKLLSSNKNSTLKEWLEETLSQRNSYKEKLEKFLEINKFKGDPLGGGENEEGGGWNNFFDKTEIKHLISIDVDRTFQDRDLFCEPSIKEIEYNVLFLFAENNQPISYKQGMNDILSMLIFILYPYYTNSNNKNYNNEEFDKWVGDPNNYAKDIYNFFHDEDEFQSDLYYLMTNLMKLGINKFFEENSEKEKTDNYLVKRCDSIFDKIKIQNNKLFYHFINNKLDIGVILQRWIKCLFTREFHPKDCSIIWFIILSDEIINPSNELIYIDFICIAMIDYISDDLLKKDQNECFQRLFNYPPLESINILLSLAEKIKSNFSKKSQNNLENRDLKNNESGKNSNNKTSSGSMANFLFSLNNNTNKNNNKNQVNKKPNLMFGGNYTNSKINENSNQKNNQTINKQQISHKKVPMFGSDKAPMFPNDKTNKIGKEKIPMFGNFNNNSKSNKNSNAFPTSTFINSKSFHVSNEENVKMLNELRNLVESYTKEFSSDDKMKIGFLIDQLSKEL